MYSRVAPRIHYQDNPGGLGALPVRSRKQPWGLHFGIDDALEVLNMLATTWR